MQLRILLDKADHYTHKEIAQRMGMSHRTVDSHIDIMRYRLIDGDVPRVLSLLIKTR
jgi:DNA-binding CsgD family transcriptional regulator